MMIPILEAVLSEVLTDPNDAEADKGKAAPSQISPKNMRAMLAMSVCMSANIGGTATTIGRMMYLTIGRLMMYLITGKMMYLTIGRLMMYITIGMLIIYITIGRSMLYL